MDLDSFWTLIENVRNEASSNDQATFLQKTKEKLLQLSSQEIAAWYKIYISVVAQADHRALWQACDDCGIYVSDDAFYYFRAWLVSQGKETYTAVLDDPDCLFSLITNPNDASFEAFNYVAWRVYTQKFCEEHFTKQGMARYYKQWLSENLAPVDETLMRPGETRREYGLRLFNYHLEEEFDIFSAVEKLSFLDETLSVASKITDAQQKTATENRQLSELER